MAAEPPPRTPRAPAPGEPPLTVTVGRAALPYGVSVGRLHASDVLPRLRFNAARAEREEGLAFAEAFGVGVSLHFKLGKLLLSLLIAAAALQLPILVYYARHGRFADARRARGARDEVRWQVSGALLARYSMAAVAAPAQLGETADARRRDLLLVSCFAALATALLGAGAAAARDFVRRDARALRSLSPAPEHYAVFLREVSDDATPASVRRAVERAVEDARVEHVAVHRELRPALEAALAVIAAEDAHARAPSPRRAARAAAARRRLAARARAPRGRAIAAFVVCESPRHARAAHAALARRAAALAPRRRRCFEKPNQLLGAPLRPSLAPAPSDVIWENLEVSPRERLARRVAVRVLTIAVIAAGLLVVYGVRRRAIRDFDVDDDFDAAAAPPAGNNATQPDILRNARNALEPYLTHAPSRKRHALFLLVVVVLINSLLRLLVRRGAMLGAHSTRTTEQSAALVAYWAAATANTMGVYALAAWGGRARTSAYDGARLTRWYADVGVYLLATLLWEALAPPAGALVRCLFRADARRELERVRAFFGRRRTLRESVTRENLFDERPVSADQNAPAWRRGLDQYVVAPLARFVAAPPWDPTTRGADMLRVFFVGAVFGAGQPLLPVLSAATLSVMLAHDKWALLRERRPPPRLGPHLARTAARLMPLAAPLHCLLALWTWSDSTYTGAALWIHCAPLPVSGATWPLLLALVGCVAAGVGPSVSSRSGCGRRPGDPHIGGSSWQEPHVEVPRRDSFERTASWTGWDVENVENADDEVAAALPWRAARRGWDAAGVDFAYDLWEGGYPDLLRTRRLVRRTAVLSSTAASSAAAALALLARESRTGPSGGGDSSNTAL